ncbi:MarR family transcriptional regulator [Rhodobacterales bacterium HKCCE2091]|nr:MarR family transcriptional regulator [Rhodobacterales bacterium HKCCE2091]
MQADGATEIDTGPDLAGLETSLGFLLRIAQVRVFDDFFDKFGDEGLRPGEFSALWLVLKHDGIRQGEVARALRIKPAHMTKMVRRLEDRGVLRREVPDDDRRSVRLHLSPEGAAWVQENHAQFLGHHNYLEHDLSDAEIHQLGHLLRRFAGIPEKTR